MWIDRIPFDMAPEDFISLLGAAAAMVSVMAVWAGLVARNPMAARARNLLAHRSELRAELLAAPRRHERREFGVGLMHRVVERLNLMRSDQIRKVTRRLSQAGWRRRDALVIYLFLKVALPLVFGIVAAFLIYGVGIFGDAPMFNLVFALGAVLAGAFAPELAVKNKIGQRQQKIRLAMPDGLDLMVICAEAGLSLDAMLERVSRELSLSWVELADELSFTVIELGFLPQRREALDHLTIRAGIPEIRALTNTLAQTEKYGTPLSHSLRVLAKEFRDERLTRAEEKAARLPAVLTVPMIVFILPALFIVLIGPAVLNVLDGLGGMK
ncbi:type II secretion system F family protein [Rhodospirillaceae bacterium AH-315-P19]|nr:type II secretion system F family protein [Rhodospirillaceae bacterium AH-315-P19]